MFGIESYIAVPLNRRDGSYFGTLCALDPLPAQLSDDDFEIFSLLSSLIAFEIEADEQHRKRMAEVRALEDIIAIAAHDLRQPLAALTGRAELLMMRARQRNYRTSDATNRGVRGTGLGLYVVQRIIALHGGVAWAEHAPGGGLQICFDLPLGV